MMHPYREPDPTAPCTCKDCLECFVRRSCELIDPDGFARGENGRELQRIRAEVARRTATDIDLLLPPTARRTR